jgi:tRNA (guanine-N7-)-methyltransferase
MSDFKRPQINKTLNLKHQNYYTLGLNGEFAEYAFSEERAPQNKGLWRSQIFKVGADQHLDLEIGTGNGVHFQTHLERYPERNLVGIELKYKPLIQTIRGALRKNCLNGRVVRYHAFNIDELFIENELDNIYIHFPDPWTTPRKPKNRILQPRMLDLFWQLQKPGSYLDFKTDSREAFLWSLENVQNCKYKIEFQTLNLHSLELKEHPIVKLNVITQFERIFMSQSVEINFIRLRKVVESGQTNAAN